MTVGWPAGRPISEIFIPVFGFVEFLVQLFLLELLDRDVDDFDSPLDINEASDRVLGDIAWRSDGLSQREASGDESFARVHQVLDVVVGHRAAPGVLAKSSNSLCRGCVASQV